MGKYEEVAKRIIEDDGCIHIEGAECFILDAIEMAAILREAFPDQSDKPQAEASGELDDVKEVEVCLKYLYNNFNTFGVADRGIAALKRIAARPAPTAEKAQRGKDDDLRLEMHQFDQLCAFVEHARVNGRTISDTEETIKIQQMLKQIERQFPAPTQWAYDQACTALHKHEAAEKALREALVVAATVLADNLEDWRVREGMDSIIYMRVANALRVAREALAAPESNK